MCINLPVVDPTKITCPVLLIRAEHDGITTDEDNAAFFASLAAKDKQLIVMSGQAHNVTYGINRHRFWYALRTFLEFPARADLVSSR
jgi:esterase/lipase